MRISRVILYFLIGVYLAHFIFYYPNLPETVATHFSGSGEPNGWMSKQSFGVLEIILLVLIVLEFTILPLFIEKLPNAWINLPNKDFWLASERRSETFLIIRRYFEWFSAALLSLLIVVNHLVFRANMRRENLPGTAMWIAIAIFFVFAAAWLLKFVRQFRIKRNVIE